MNAFKHFFQCEKEVAQFKHKLIEHIQQQGKSPPKERMSNIQAVEDIPHRTGHPLHISDIIQLAEEPYQIKLQRDSKLFAADLQAFGFHRHSASAERRCSG